jgi:protein ImuA
MNFETLLSKGLVRPAKASPVAGAGFPFGLGVSGLHELAEAGYGDRAAMTGFLLAAMRPAARGAWLWVQQAAIGRDSGDVPEAALSTSPARLRLMVRARNTREALWATEEAIVSGAASMVVAEIEEADFTATRRLALASGRYGVPVALLLPYSCSGPTAASARWRISPRPSAPNRYDPHAPGYPRWRAVLERCRTAPSVAGQAFDLEWNDETLSLRVAAGLAAGPAAPRPSAGTPALHRKAG